MAGQLNGGAPVRYATWRVAVNGRIERGGAQLPPARAPLEYFSLMLPEPALRCGRNSLQLLEVRRADGWSRSR